MTLLLVLLALLLLHSALSGPLARTPVTAPILFTTAGVVCALLGLVRSPSAEGVPVLLHVAELGLVLLLFTDGCRTDLAVLRHIRALPSRLLTVGLLLTLALGTGAAALLFPALSIWEAAILGAILAPTDAGLGQVVVSDERVPLNVRQALNVEAGLNDGLCVPFLLFFMAVVGATGDGESVPFSSFLWEQLGLGTAVGLGVGLFGGRLLRASHERGWLTETAGQVGVVTLALICAVAAAALDASLFIAAFVGGLAVRSQHPEAGHESTEFTEAWGGMLNLSVFFLLGLLVVRHAEALEPVHALYAVASLTVVRMLPVALSLLGAGLDRRTVLFIGWFGPRGLASIVLALVYLEHRLPGHSSTIRLAALATVAISVYAHGLSARPGIRWLAASKRNPAPESVPAAGP
jgi:NhaP-type Na+/H+ or K+/H+ antiporter